MRNMKIDPWFWAGLKVRRSGWSRDMEKFIEWLLAFDFEGCGQDNAAIAEGLADALVVCMFKCIFCFLLLSF